MLRSLTKPEEFTEEDQHIYNNTIIDTFIESVNEMNSTVMIPSKLKDLESLPTLRTDDLYECFQQINVVKTGMFEPHLHPEAEQRANNVFEPKSRKSVKSIADLVDEKTISMVTVPNVMTRQHSNPSKEVSREASYADLECFAGTDRNGNCGQSPDELADLFVHHLHSLYHILEHFTKAAKYITKQYIEQFEQ